MKNRWMAVLFVLYALVLCVILFVNGVFTGEVVSVPNLVINLGFLLVIGVLFVISAVSFNRLARFNVQLGKAASKLNAAYREAGHRVTPLTGSNYAEVFTDPALKNALYRYVMRLDKYRTRTGYRESPDIDEYINEDLVDRVGANHFNSGVSGALTGLGILGTFLGLSIGLGSFQGDNIYTISDNVGPLLTGMKVAFHTSVYGIFFSLVYNVIYRAVMAEAYEKLESFRTVFRQVAQPAAIDPNMDLASLLVYQANTANAVKEILDLQKGTAQVQIDQLQAVADQFVAALGQTCGTQLQGLGEQLRAVTGAEEAVLEQNQALAKAVQGMVESNRILQDAVSASLDHQRKLAAELQSQRGILESASEDISNQLYTYQKMQQLVQ